MENTVTQRLNIIVDTFEKGIKSAFANRVGISQQGAHDLLSSRKGGPSFKVLTSILESYPQIRIDWLVLGRGPMLQSEGVQQPQPENAQVQIQGRTLQEIIASYIKSGEMRAEIESIYEDVAAKQKDRESASRQVYAVAKKYPYGPDSQLSIRLGVTEEEAQQLILDGQIQASDLGKLGFRVSEQAVRDFLAQHQAT